VHPPPPPGAPPAHDFPCQNCGAKLHYDATTQALKCPYCGATQGIAPPPPPPQQHHPTAGPGREIPIEEGYRLAQRGWGTPTTQITCGDCGATVNVVPGEQTAKCTFCGSFKVLAQEATGTAIRPESIVPFRVDKATANVTFARWLGSLWFRPSDLGKMAQLEALGGVYVPFWTFDAWVHSDWTAEAGYHYYETEYYTDDEGNQQSRQVQYTRWAYTSGARRDFFDDVLVCASRGLPPALVEKFQSFDTQQLTPYQPQFLAGWKAELYAVDLMPAWGSAQQIIHATQESRCASDVPGDTHRLLEVRDQLSNVTFKHVLLPIWIAAYRYNGKPYQFLVNGQTGEVVGHAPWSVWKILFAVVLGLAILAVIVFIVASHQQGTRPMPGSSPTYRRPAAASPRRF
jgi:DNA-directed RNA polymerase subunit RPC12/RpoP